MNIKNGIYHCLSIFPYQILRYIAQITHNDVIDAIGMQKFIDKLVERPNYYMTRISMKRKVYRIDKSICKFSFFDVCFLNTMIGNLLYCLYCNHIPIFESIWPEYFIQPFENEGEGEAFVREWIPCSPQITDIFDNKKMGQWMSVFPLFVRYNSLVKGYVEEECQVVLKKGNRHGKTIGVLVRGTDYLALKPKGHPIQPTIEEIFERIDSILGKEEIDKIYVATEDKTVFERFKRRYGERIAENKRQYFDEQYMAMYKKDGDALITNVHFDRDNDDWHKGVEYLSSINILSRCDYLIAGACGGSFLAIILNGGAYLDTTIFNCGYYD